MSSHGKLRFIGREKISSGFAGASASSMHGTMSRYQLWLLDNSSLDTDNLSIEGSVNHF